MGIASRKTWLEKQDDDVQLLVLSMDDAGKTLEMIQEAVRQKFDQRVPISTLAHSLMHYHNTLGREQKLAALFATEMDTLFKSHPTLDPRLLAKGFITMRLKDAREGAINAGDLLSLAQAEGRLKLRERELAAKEEANRLKARQIDLLEEKMRAVSEKVQGARKEAAKKKLTPAEYRQRLDEIYGLVEAK